MSETPKPTSDDPKLDFYMLHKRHSGLTQALSDTFSESASVITVRFEKAMLS